MTNYIAVIKFNGTWEFEVEADNEEAAYEELWKEIGYDGEGILDLEPDSEYMDISLRIIDG